MQGEVIAVSRDGEHRFSKENQAVIELVAGLGVRGDAHLGTLVQHRVRVRENPDRPNLRQVHLIHSELFEELTAGGYDLFPGAIGENITTRGLNLLQLPAGTKLHLGRDAVVEVTGLRNPCRQVDAFRRGLMQALLFKHPDGSLGRKSGIMSIVLKGGEVRVGDLIRAELPREPHQPLKPV
ncbi:MAG TPA: MOSC domain-containing protein [Micropepsaceae bacterium]|nr:MOSC domain-containing protein [Micropepsaceae bacterium]